MMLVSSFQGTEKITMGKYHGVHDGCKVRVIGDPGVPCWFVSGGLGLGVTQREGQNEKCHVYGG